MDLAKKAVLTFANIVPTDIDFSDSKKNIYKKGNKKRTQQSKKAVFNVMNNVTYQYRSSFRPVQRTCRGLFRSPSVRVP